jgi:hypothetical protein
MQIRANDGWIRAGLAVLVTGVLGGGVVTLARDGKEPRKVVADGVTKPVDFAAAAPAAAADRPKSAPAVGDKVMVGGDGGSVTVSAIEDDLSAGRLFGPGKGFKYVAAEVKACSGPHEKDLSFSPDYFLLKLDDGTIRDHGAGAKKPELDPGAVPAGKCLSGWVTFTVPDGAYPAAVLYDGSSRLEWTVPLPKGAHPTTTTTGRPGATTASTSAPSDSATTSTTAGRSTTSTTAGKSTTTTTGRSATTAKAGASTTTTGKSGATTTTGKPGATTTTTTGSARPAPTTSTTTASRSTPPTTGPAAVTPAPTTPEG